MLAANILEGMYGPEKAFFRGGFVMADAAGAAGKICGFCAQDCSARPRIKDKEGRYFCKSCVEQREAEVADAQAKAQAVVARPPAVTRPASPVAATVRPATPAAMEEDDAVMLSLVEGSTQVETVACPSCGAPIAMGAVVCMGCGYNTKTGKAGGTAVAKAPSATAARLKSVKFSLTPGILVLGLLILLGLLGAATAANKDLFLAYYVVVALFSLVTTVLTVVWAFQDGNKGWGITAILAIPIPCLGLAVLYYAFAVNDRPHLKALVAIELLAGVGLGVLSVYHGIDLRTLGST
jgi:uncharacterized Zn finger protein (UPF0148 family)